MYTTIKTDRKQVFALFEDTVHLSFSEDLQFQRKLKEQQAFAVWQKDFPG